MLTPKRVKWRKVQRGRMTGRATRGNSLTFGDFGLQALEPCWMTNRQIEAARIAMTRHIKRGVGIEEIRKDLEKLTGKAVAVNVMEIKVPELDARLVGQNIVDQLEKRIAFRRAIKQAIMRTMKAGARGVKVQVSGRLGGAEIARTERSSDGKVPLHTLRADIDYANVEAFTTFGRIGVKVWIYRGEVLPDGTRSGPTRGERSSRERGPRTGNRPAAPGRAARPAPRSVAAPDVVESVVAAADPVVVETSAPEMEATQ